jgi:5'-3' exonuclease
MGVKDLWQLLAPIGRRVSIETLEGKVLAIDMSIWLTQFIKAMRDDEGKMIKNAHILGTLKRVLKLLFHKIRPVFVFDGATPQLKLRVIQARRKVRETSVSGNALKIIFS